MKKMCFSIPCKVLKVDSDVAYIEGDRAVKLGKEILVKKGEYLQIAGGVAVGKLSKTEGEKIRRLIKKLN